MFIGLVDISSLPSVLGVYILVYLLLIHVYLYLFIYVYNYLQKQAWLFYPKRMSFLSLRKVCFLHAWACLGDKADHEFYQRLSSCLLGQPKLPIFIPDILLDQKRSVY